MQPYVIGLDVGTGSTKAIAINLRGEKMALSQYHYPMLDMPPGYSEQNVEDIWKAFVAAVQKIIETVKYAPVAVSLSSCLHSVLVIDKSNKPITNLITWADTRSEEIADEIRRSPQAETIYRVTGTPIHSMSPLCKIIWLKRNAPEIYLNAYKFISIKEFIWYRLFNVYLVDQSLASASGLFNLETRRWHTGSLDICHIKASQLSDIVSTGFIQKGLQASVASVMNLPVDTPFCIGAGDGCLANIGSRALGRGVASLTIGTSAAVRIANASPVFNFPAMTFNYVLDENTFICGAPLNNGGNIVQWLFKSLLRSTNVTAQDYVNVFAMVNSVPAGSQGLLFLPYLNGERAPVWDEKACGIFFGVKPFHTNEHFLRAALEGVCYALHNIVEIIEAATAPVTQLNASGGFVQSKTWMKMLADITGKRIFLIQAEDASATGAALLAIKALGISPDYLPPLPGHDIIVAPVESNQAVHAGYYKIFASLYPLLKEQMALLHAVAGND